MVMPGLAQPREAFADPKQRGQLVAQGSGFLELQLIRCDFHFLFQSVYVARVGAIEERAGGADLFAVFALRRKRSARAEAGAEFIPQAAWRVQHGEKFLLLGEVHRLGLRTITQFEKVVDPPCGFTCHCGPFQGAEDRVFFPTRLPRHERERCGFAAQAQVDVALEARHSFDIKARHPTADQFQLADERGEFAGAGFPDNRPRAADDSPRFFLAVAMAEIAQQSLAQYRGLADVDESAVPVEHAVDARKGRAKLADAAAQVAAAFGADVLERGVVAVGPVAVGAEAEEPAAEEESVRRDFIHSPRSVVRCRLQRTRYKVQRTTDNRDWGTADVRRPLAVRARAPERSPSIDPGPYLRRSRLPTNLLRRLF